MPARIDNAGRKLGLGFGLNGRERERVKGWKFCSKMAVLPVRPLFSDFIVKKIGKSWPADVGV